MERLKRRGWEGGRVLAKLKDFRDTDRAALRIIGHRGVGLDRVG